MPSAPTRVPVSTAPAAGITTWESMTAIATIASPLIPVRSRHSVVSDPAAVPTG